MSKYPSQMQDKFNLRFPDGMRDAIAERAKANGRSMNSEIVQILQDALDQNSTVSKQLDILGFIYGDKEIKELKDNSSKFARYIDLRTNELKKTLIEDLGNILNKQSDK